MGVLDIPKAMYKAQQAKKKMASLKVAGKEGSVGIMLNGLGDVVDIEIDKIELMKETGINEEELARKICDLLTKNITKAFNHAKKELEKEMIKNTSLDDLKDLLSASGK